VIGVAPWRISQFVPFEEKSLEGRKWYVLNLEGKVEPGDYSLVTEESDVCGIISEEVKVVPGNYKLMFIEKKKEGEEPAPFPLRPEEKREVYVRKKVC